MKQVNKNHYEFERYVWPDRFASYYYQLREILALRPKNLLEVGVGDGVVGNYIKRNTLISYQNIDIAADLNPDIVGSVLSMPYPDNSFDAVCAFEVLEHLPFEKFETALSELKRVSRKHILLSLPHFGPPVKFLIKIPFLPEIKTAFKFPWPKKHVFNGEHFWEIGKREYSLCVIRNILKKYFTVEKEFIPFENQYHHFFVFEKRK